MEQNTEQSLLEWRVDYDGGNILKETTRWARFVSIVSFIGLGICIIVFLVFLAAGDAIWGYYTRLFPALEAFRAAFILLCLIFLGVFTWVVVLLYRFATLTRKGIDTQDQNLFNQGLRAGKTYFLLSAILAIIGLLFSLRNLF
ncbi:MAG: hypothetical protein Q8927_20600 [Bacteroidota bacterium]|nr:hypothetical protein [Bacteroidota bacterium]MDP4259470.1 hypothetical protein [Bacteroidota bacterium]